MHSFEFYTFENKIIIDDPSVNRFNHVYAISETSENTILLMLTYYGLEKSNLTPFQTFYVTNMDMLRNFAEIDSITDLHPEHLPMLFQNFSNFSNPILVPLN